MLPNARPIARTLTFLFTLAALGAALPGCLGTQDPVPTMSPAERWQVGLALTAAPTTTASATLLRNLNLLDLKLPNQPAPEHALPLSAVQAQLAAGATKPNLPMPTTKPHDNLMTDQVMRHYIRARDALNQNDLPAVIKECDLALQIDPQSYATLILTARARIGLNQVNQASIYLQRAYMQDPTGFEANFLLGSFWYDRQDLITAAHHFGSGLQGLDDAPLRTDALTCKLLYIQCLQKMGYHRAAASVAQELLLALQSPRVSYRYDNNAAEMMQQQWVIALVIADNLLAAGAAPEAWPYLDAALLCPPDQLPLVLQRRTRVALRQSAALAQREIVALLGTTGGSADACAWLDYLDNTASAANLGPAPAFDLTPPPGINGNTMPRGAELVTILRLQRRGQIDAALQRLQTILAQPAGQHPISDHMLDWALAHSQGNLPAGITTLAHAQGLFAQDSEELRDLTQTWVARWPASASVSLATWQPTGTPAIQARSHYVAAWCLFHTLQLRPALQHAQAALRLDPQLAPAYILAFDLSLTLGQPATVNSLIAQAGQITNRPTETQLWPLLWLVRQENFQAALPEARLLRDRYPDAAHVRRTLLDVLQARGQIQAAQLELLGYVRRFPDDLTFAFLLAQQLWEQNDAAAQEQWWQFFTKDNPRHPIGMLLAARLLLADAQTREQGLSLLDQLAHHPQRNAEITHIVALLRYGQRQTDAALAVLADQLQEPTLQLSTLDIYIELLARQNKTDTALAYLEQYHQRFTGLPLMQLAYVRNLLRLDRKAEARTAFGTLHQWPGDDPDLLIAIAEIARRNEWGDHLAIARDYLQRHGPQVDVQYYLSSHLAATQPAQSEILLREILRQWPTHTGAANDLAYRLAEQGKNLPEALDLIDDVLRQRPGQSGYIDTKGWVLYKQGKFTEAKTLLTKALSDPAAINHPVLLAHMADILIRLDQRDLAREYYLRVVQGLNDHPRTGETAEIYERAQAALEALRNNAQTIPTAPVP
jgi:Tfp pilus assembly protein PilF